MTTLKMLSELDDRELFNMCLSDNETNELCKNEDFWKDRALNKYGYIASYYKPDEKNWRKFYLQLVYDLDVKDPWFFFDDHISLWEIKDEPDIENIHVVDFGTNLGVDVDPENIHDYKKRFEWNEKLENQFHFLNLGKRIKLELKADYFGDVIYTKKLISEFFISPADVLLAIYNFYQEPIDVEDFKILLKEEHHFAENFELKDVKKERVKHIDMFGNLIFKTITKIGDNSYSVEIDDEHYSKQKDLIGHLSK